MAQNFNIGSLDLALDLLANHGKVYGTNVTKAFRYEDGKRTDQQIGIKVDVVFPSNGYQSMTVTVASTIDPLSETLKKADADHPVCVTFDDFHSRIYHMDGRMGISAKAAAVRIVDTNNGFDDFN